MHTRDHRTDRLRIYAPDLQRETDSRVFNSFSVLLFWMFEIKFLFVQMSIKLAAKFFLLE